MVKLVKPDGHGTVTRELSKPESPLVPTRTQYSVLKPRTNGAAVELGCNRGMTTRLWSPQWDGLF
jgi:hypothetical protein